MLLKEILSREKYTLNEIVDKKMCNSKLYEKSYIRSLLIDSIYRHSVENNKQFFTQKKKLKRIKRKPPQTFKRQFKVYGPRSHLARRRKCILKRGYKGSSSYTTVLLYKSRKSNFIRFESIQTRVCRPSRFVDLFLKGVKTLITGTVKKRENSLIILCAKKGGFSCYSSGFRGFLPKTEFKKMINIGLNNKSKECMSAFKRLMGRRRVQWYVSSPPRFRFVIKTLTKAFRFRRNSFVLSRKKKSHTSTRLLPRIVFFSMNRGRINKKRRRTLGSKLIKKWICRK